MHSEQISRRCLCEHPVHDQTGRLQALPHGQIQPLYDGSPTTDAEDERTMNEQPRPRANSWQIAGVWISAAALLIAAARAAIDLWPLFR